MTVFSNRALVMYCGILMSLSAFSVDIILPAFSLISSDLGSVYASVQMIIPVFILSIGFGQIIMGPLSDRYGRKPVILGGLVIYLAGALVCLFAPNIEILLLGRVIQGIGAAVGPVVSRAILRDMFLGQELARNMALATMLFAFGPIVAPLFGAIVLQFGSWRYVFLTIAMFSLSIFVAGILRLEETNANKDRSALAPSRIASNIKVAFSNPQSRFYIGISGPVMLTMLLILTTLPRIFMENYGIEGSRFALLFAIHGFGIIIGQVINRRMIPQIGTVNAMRVGSIVLLFASLLMAALHSMGVLLGPAGPYVMVACMVLFATGYLVVFSNAASLALDPHKSLAGFVSSLFGFVSQCVASLCAMVLAVRIGGDLSSFLMTLIMVTGAVVSILFLLPGRHSDSMAKDRDG